MLKNPGSNGFFVYVPPTMIFLPSFVNVFLAMVSALFVNRQSESDKKISPFRRRRVCVFFV